MTIKEIIKKFPSEKNLKTQTRPYFNHSIEFKKNFNAEERAEMLEKAGLNVFFFPSVGITGCDFLSDSGTTTMTNEQWAALHQGDESYGSNRGYFILMQKIREIFGEQFFNEPSIEKPNAFIFHQGRSAENALFRTIGQLNKNQIIPSNGHFDTTQANIEANQIKAINLFSSELKDPNSTSQFKGNMNTEKLKKLIKESKEKIPLIYLTITNNMGGGLFIKNTGLFMTKYPQIPDELMNYQILTEGHPTYGGLSGRDIMTLCVGLGTITKEEYLDHRIKQVQDFGKSFQEKGIPILTPVGGHAIYLDVNKFFQGTKIKPEDFGGIGLTAVLLATYGHRACELGNFAFGSYNPKTKEEKFPEVNFVRFAIPRLRYEKKDLDSVAESLKELYEKRHLIPPVEVIYGKELSLRHFKARFKFKK